MIRRIVSVLMVTAMLLATMVAPAFADSTRVCNNRCGNVDMSTNTTTTTTTTTTTSGNTTSTTTQTCGNLSEGSSCNIS